MAMHVELPLPRLRLAELVLSSSHGEPMHGVNGSCNENAMHTTTRGVGRYELILHHCAIDLDGAFFEKCNANAMHNANAGMHSNSTPSITNSRRIACE